MARFTNQAQIRYGDAVSNSNIAVGEILEVLSVTKTAVRNTYGQNDSVTYIVSIVNAGTVPFTGITVTDNLGAYPFGGNTLVPLTYIAGTAKYYVNGVDTGNTCCYGRTSACGSRSYHSGQWKYHSDL